MPSRTPFRTARMRVLLSLLVGGLAAGCSGEEPRPAFGGADPSRSAEALAAPQDAQREPIPLDHQGPIPIRVYMSPACGCCGDWVTHLEENGFEVDVQLRHDMGTVKESFGVAPRLSSCHTGIVNGYVVEGHVPADDIRRFLAEAPAARGLAVPGMPVGSPGMEWDGHVDPYDVLLFSGDGRVSVFARHGR